MGGREREGGREEEREGGRGGEEGGDGRRVESGRDDEKKTANSSKLTHHSPTSAVMEAIPPKMKGFKVLILLCNCC